MIIDYSYFIGKINLPQTGNTPGRAEIDQFIETYEKEYLQRVLGYDLWKAFTDETGGSGEIDQRWTDLLTGAEYSHGDHTHKWEGFEDKPSPIAQYVYYRYMEDKAIDTVLVGTSTGDTDNATRVSPAAKMLDAWNNMIRLNVKLWNFLNANRSTYPEWKGYQSWPLGWYWPYPGDWGYRVGVGSSYGYGYDHPNELFNRKNSLDL